MWSAVAPVDVEDPAPSARSKHSATLVGDNVYLLGGRNGNLPMKDFWKYNIKNGKWHLLKPNGDKLPSLQEHSAVVYRDCIYVFGGEVGFSAGTETPLWCYDIKNNTWRKIRSKKGVTTPAGRRGHSALVHRGTMLVYGGYQDLRGSCNELWAFHFETESWHLLSTSTLKTSSNLDVLPPPRHKHSAIIHDDSMWVYGGMTDLQERSDLWKWDTVTKRWYLIKTKVNPGPLHSHAVCKLPSAMLLFGGERNGHPTNDLWKFNFSIESWEKITVTEGTKPQPRSESVAFSISELTLNESSNSPENKTIRLRSRTCCLSADRNSRHSSYLPNNRVAPCEKTYIFQASQTNYTDGSEVAQHYFEDKPSRGLLQEISRMSRLNSKCNYTVLTGCTTDSTESLLRQHATPPTFDEVETEIVTPSTGTMVKSKSAYVIKKKYPVEVDEQREIQKRKNETMKKITREPISVPNFSILALTTTPVLTPVEATKLVFLDTDEENEILKGSYTCDGKTTNMNVCENINPPKRGESYSSHLGYADNPLYQHMMMKLRSEHENVSATSDYASIETINRFSSASSYSVKTNAGQDENQKNQEKDGPFGFCNPHYMGPDIKSLLNNGEKKRTFAKLLNRQDSVGMHSSDEDLLELQEYNGFINKNTTVVYRNSQRNHSGNSTLGTAQHPKDSKRRAHSAGRVERNATEKAPTDTDFDKILDHYVPLYVYVVGGKEHGQVTIFQRPISIWKLKLF